VPLIVLLLSEVPPAPTPSDTQRSRAESVEHVGKFRDGILVAGGGLYVLGYLVWSFHAWEEGLGLLPALELQYLLAGSLLALTLLAALSAGMAVARLMAASASWGKSEHRLMQLLARSVTGWIGLAVALLSFFLLVLAGHEVIAFVLPAIIAVSFIVWGVVDKLGWGPKSEKAEGYVYMAGTAASLRRRRPSSM
jgi:hypothetical protein